MSSYEKFAQGGYIGSNDLGEPIFLDNGYVIPSWTKDKIVKEVLEKMNNPSEKKLASQVILPQPPINLQGMNSLTISGSGALYQIKNIPPEGILVGASLVVVDENGNKVGKAYVNQPYVVQFSDLHFKVTEPGTIDGINFYWAKFEGQNALVASLKSVSSSKGTSFKVGPKTVELGIAGEGKVAHEIKKFLDFCSTNPKGKWSAQNNADALKLVGMLTAEECLEAKKGLSSLYELSSFNQYVYDKATAMLDEQIIEKKNLVVLPYSIPFFLELKKMPSGKWTAGVYQEMKEAAKKTLAGKDSKFIEQIKSWFSAKYENGEFSEHQYKKGLVVLQWAWETMFDPEILYEPSDDASSDPFSWALTDEAKEIDFNFTAVTKKYFLVPVKPSVTSMKISGNIFKKNFKAKHFKYWVAFIKNSEVFTEAQKDWVFECLVNYTGISMDLLESHGLLKYSLKGTNVNSFNPNSSIVSHEMSLNQFLSPSAYSPSCSLWIKFSDGEVQHFAKQLNVNTSLHGATEIQVALDMPMGSFVNSAASVNLQSSPGSVMPPYDKALKPKADPKFEDLDYDTVVLKPGEQMIFLGEGEENRKVKVPKGMNYTHIKR